MSQERTGPSARATKPADKFPVCRTGTFRPVQTRWGLEWWCTVCQPRVARLEPAGVAEGQP